MTSARLGCAAIVLGSALAGSWSGACEYAMTRLYLVCKVRNDCDQPDDATQAPQALIHVTCTGYIAPSSAQKRVATLGWGNVRYLYQ